MGNTSTMVIFWAMFSLVTGLVALSILAVNPDDDRLLSNYLFHGENEVGNQITKNGDVWTLPTNGTKNKLISDQQSTVGEIGSFIFPDWIRSAYYWVTGTMETILNIVGAPYTFLTMFNIPSQISALIGSAWALISIFTLVNWIRGSDS